MKLYLTAFVLSHLLCHASCSTISSDVTTSSNDVTVCPHPDCVNGDDADNCVTTCNCDVGNVTYFSGSSCETIILNGTVETETSAKTCNLTWDNPPNIEQSQYQFVYMAIGVDEENGTKTLKEIEKIIDVIYKQDFDMIDENETVARVTELESGGVKYTVCVIQNDKADDLVEFQNNTDRINSENYSDCVDIVTQNNDLLWEYTLAAYIIAGLLILAVIALIIMKLVADHMETKKKEKYNQLAKEQTEEIVTDEPRSKKTKPDKAKKNKTPDNKYPSNSIDSRNRSQYMQHVLHSQMVHSKNKVGDEKSDGSVNLAYEQEKGKSVASRDQVPKSDWFDDDSEPDADY